MGKMLYIALIDQIDFGMGDWDLFAQRNFKDDIHSDFNTCIIVDILCRIFKNINSLRNYEDRITYQIVSPTSRFEWLKGCIGQASDSVCCILISLQYG